MLDDEMLDIVLDLHLAQVARADDDCRLCAQAQSRAVRKAHGDEFGRLRPTCSSPPAAIRSSWPLPISVASIRRGRWPKNWVAAGAIGEVRQVNVRGGQGLLNDCSHLLDMMRYVDGRSAGPCG